MQSLWWWPCRCVSSMWQWRRQNSPSTTAAWSNNSRGAGREYMLHLWQRGVYGLILSRNAWWHTGCLSETALILSMIILVILTNVWFMNICYAICHLLEIHNCWVVAKFSNIFIISHFYGATVCSARCQGCVSSRWGCNWCIHQHICTHKRTCSEGVTIYNQNVSTQGGYLETTAKISWFHWPFISSYKTALIKPGRSNNICRACRGDIH